MKTIKLKNIENEYRDKVRILLEQGKRLSVDDLINLSLSLFHELKAKGIDSDKDKDCDMLLFQYGVYNWGGELGEHFSFDITRQFISPKNDEPYQLSLKLIFDATEFKNSERYSCWSCDFENLDKWAQHIKTTKGYELAQKQAPKSHQISYDKV